MVTRSIFIFLLGLTAGLLPLFPALGSSWEEVKQDAGITVYNRNVEGSDLDEFKVVSTLEAGIDVVASVLNDISAYPGWYENCSHARVLERSPRGDMALYIELDISWPASNRDLVMRTRIQTECVTGRVVIDFWAIPDPLVPVKDDMVRVTRQSGRWLLEYVEANKTRVTYILQADPGGRIPTFVARHVSRNMPFSSMVGLIKAVGETRYLEKEDHTEWIQEVRTCFQNERRLSAPILSALP